MRSSPGSMAIRTGLAFLRLTKLSASAILLTQMSDTLPGPPPVPHHINCTCALCCAARAAEVRRRLEEARREDRRGRELAHLEAMGGVVYARLGMPRPQPGTLAAIRRRYGR